MNQVFNTNIIPLKKKIIYILIVLAVVFIYIFSIVQLKLTNYCSYENLQRAAKYVGKMLAMNFTEWQDVFVAALQSISVAVLATIISAFLAFFISFFAASNVSVRGVALFLKGFAAIIRAVPTLIWALIFVAYLGFGPFAGVLGLGFHSFAYLVKAYSQSIEEVDNGCIEAMRATGSSWLQIMARGVVPTIKTSIISWTALRFEFNIGASAILGMVGAGGIGFELNFNIRQFDFNKAGFVLLIIFIMSFSVEMLFNKLKINVDGSRLKEK